MQGLQSLGFGLFVVYCFWTVLGLIITISIIAHNTTDNRRKIDRAEAKFLVAYFVSQFAFWAGMIIAFGFRAYHWG